MRVIMIAVALLVFASASANAPGSGASSTAATEQATVQATEQAIDALLALEPAAFREAIGGADIATRSRFLLNGIASGKVRELGDERIIEIIRAVGVDALLEASQTYLRSRPTYEMRMTKRERVRGSMPDKPDIMFVRIRSKPFAVYSRWLADGRNEGQEILHDSAIDAGNIIAHKGGMLSFATVTLPLDHWAVQRQTNHRVTDLGFEPVIALLQEDLEKVRRAGGESKIEHIGITTRNGERVGELRVVSPGGDVSYAKRARILLNLQDPLPRVLELFDDNDELMEFYAFDDVQWMPLPPTAFQRGNKEYRF